MSVQQPTAPGPKDPALSETASIRLDHSGPEYPARDLQARHLRVVGTASALLAVAFVLIASLVYTRISDHTFGDEIAGFSAAFFVGAILLSFMAVRPEAGGWHKAWIDRLLLAGTAILTVAMLVVAVDLL
jgi:hypothetical protein